VPARRARRPPLRRPPAAPGPDLRRASAAEREELAEWIAYYKANRELLLTGDLHRLDFPDPALTAFGVVAPDKSRAIYSFAAVDRSEVALLGRLRFPGLDPARRYRISPVLVGRMPSGLRPPLWWGVQREWSDELEELSAHEAPRFVPTQPEPGVVLPGSVLIRTGLMDAPVDPDHAVLYDATAVD